MNSNTTPAASASRHTPGPWVAMEFGGEYPSVEVCVSNTSPADKRAKCKHWITSVPLFGPDGSAAPGRPFDDWTGSSAAEQRANAFLIAASPELLTALEVILVRASCAPHDDAEAASREFQRIVDYDRAAIAKAKIGRAHV